MWTYKARLARDLDRWSARGWVTADGEKGIRAELAESRRGPRLAGALGILGAVLLGFAAMSFVAANWQHMSKLARLAMMMVGLWASYGAATWLRLRRLDVFGEAAILAGVAVFGAAIMLITQMYHMEGNPPDAVLTWALGALGAGVVLRSRAALGASLPLAGLWSGWQAALNEGVHWALLPMLALLVLASLWLRWRPGLHVVVMMLAAWVCGLGYLLPNYPHHGVVVAIGLAAVAAALAAEQAWPSLTAVTAPATAYAALVGFAGLFAMQFFVRDASILRLSLLAVATLAGLIAQISWWLHLERRSLAWLGYAGFSAELLALYFKTFGTLLDTSLFFLVAGLIVIGLSAIAYRLHMRETSRPETVS